MLKDFPGISIYGEVYGRGVQELEYGVKEPHFVAFDIWDQGMGWWGQDTALAVMVNYGVPTVPILYEGPYRGPEHLIELLEYHKNSQLALHNGAKQVSEGLVVQSLNSRKILKLVSNYYLEGAK